MITRVFEISDTYTKDFYLVVQFEEIDKDLCKKLLIAPGFKIINRIVGRRVESFAGYSFNPEDPYENIENQSSKVQIDGTIQSFGILLSGFKDIKKLPERIDLEKIRRYWSRMRKVFVNNNIIELIADYSKDDLRKILYRSIQNHIAIIDVSKNEVLISIGSTSELERLIPEYLWIPVKEISENELNCVEISPFKINIILPEYL